MFHDQTIECPVCPKWTNKKGVERGEQLELVESNYSGCGVDIAECAQCHRRFQISYKVARITELSQ